MHHKKGIGFKGILLIILVIGLLFVVGFKRVNTNDPRTVYRVYLDGERIGLLENDQELYNLIDKEQEEIKSRFGVDRVYPPSGLEVTEYITYENDFKTADEIYRLIEQKSTFTVLGYTVTIKAEDKAPITINVLNEEDVEPALMDAVSAFVDSKSLESYLSDSQEKVTDTGKTIESVYFDEDIKIKESYLPVDSDIITNRNDLTKYLLFGTLKKQDSYTVKSGDTVETIAFNNKLSNEELLIANPNLSSVNTLLSSGQKLNIGLINPLFTVVEESEVIEDVKVNYRTVYEEDSNRYPSQTYVKTEGISGITRMTEKVQYKNGVVMTLYVSNTQEISAPVNKVVVKGTKVNSSSYYNYYPPAASDTDWGWPTTTPYKITSHYGYRWGRLHGGIDISGTGFGSPIYAAADGVVTNINKSCANVGYYGNQCGGEYGNYVYIRTTTGLATRYAHLRNDIRVTVGQTVKKGQLIGTMGSSGSSTGTHLHFEVRDENGNRLDPCKVAFKC